MIAVIEFSGIKSLIIPLRRSSMDRKLFQYIVQAHGINRDNTV